MLPVSTSGVGASGMLLAQKALKDRFGFLADADRSPRRIRAVTREFAADLGASPSLFNQVVDNAEELAYGCLQLIS